MFGESLLLKLPEKVLKHTATNQYNISAVTQNNHQYALNHLALKR